MREKIEVHGTSYDVGTPKEVIHILEQQRNNRNPSCRLRLHYGDQETGLDWLETFETTGYIGRSMGPTKVPIILHNVRSQGGGPISTASIVRIRWANERTGGDLYRHPQYHVDREAVRLRNFGVRTA